MKKRSLAYPEKDYRICILAFSESHQQISVRAFHSNEKILPDLVMSDGVLYGNTPCLRFVDPVALRRVQNVVQDALKDWANWEEVPVNNLCKNVVLAE